MSFLNPVSLPVRRFSSTDEGAPQIDYASRVAGDVKTVVKACLDTGYGDTASAGWTIQNETDFGAEFVSPDTAMSDYRLCVDDTSASSTQWYYQYQDARNDMRYNTVTKNISYIDKQHANNGWQLLVTDRGLIFIELMQHSAVNDMSARLTFFSQIKSALVDSADENIGFFNIGHNAAINSSQSFYRNTYTYFNVAAYQNVKIFNCTPFNAGTYKAQLDVSLVDITSAMYLTNDRSELVLGQLPGMHAKFVNNANEIYGITDTTLDVSNVLKVCAGSNSGDAQSAKELARVYLINTDMWEY